VRPATIADVRRYYGELKTLPTVDAVVGELAGDLIGIGGFAHIQGRIVGFMDLKPAARPWVIHLYRAVREYMRKAQDEDYKIIYVEPNKDEPTADRFLRHFGFEPVDDGAVYRWKNK
jgi:hypothetical protein